MREAALGLYTYAEFALCTALFLPIMGASHVLHRDDPTQRIPGRWMRRFGRTTSALTPLWRFSIEGQPPADILEKPYVVVANHESTADPFLLSSLPWDMRWVAKQEIFDLPILGTLMRFGGDIPLRRGSRASVEAMLHAARATLAAGCPVMIFPEGTRSADGRLGAFKDGAFQLAIECGVPILPIAVAGTRACRPKGSRWFGDARAIAKVLPPIESAGLGLGDLADLRERTRAVIESALPDLRTRTGCVFGRASSPRTAQATPGLVDAPRARSAEHAGP
jgi:1-acyl-sn-glycerol-3-phosphate acyltransferase